MKQFLLLTLFGALLSCNVTEHSASTATTASSAQPASQTPGSSTDSTSVTNTTAKKPPVRLSGSESSTAPKTVDLANPGKPKHSMQDAVLKRKP